MCRRINEHGCIYGPRLASSKLSSAVASFLALDEATGDTLWQFKTGSSVNSTAITYTHNGQQYVSVASGLGGGLATRYAKGEVPTGGSVWTFALMPE